MKHQKAARAAGILAGSVFLTGGGLLLGAAAYMYKKSLVSERGIKNEEESEMPSCAEGARWLNRHPRKESVFSAMPGGMRLHALYLKRPEECSRYAICVHGFKNEAATMGVYARQYYEKYGMNVLIPDLRGHGESDGNIIGMGYPDREDILHWIGWIVEKDPEAAIVLHGMSMGAATVLLTTGEELPGNVKACVSDSAYTNALDESTYVYLNLNPHPIPAGPLMRTVRLLALRLSGFDLDRAAPEEAVKHSHTPTLFIHGEKDGFIPPSMMPVLYNNAVCPKAFLWIPDADHVQGIDIHPEIYWKGVEKFLDGINPFLLKGEEKAQEEA